MAINNFFNITVDPSAANKPQQYHAHTAQRSTSSTAGGFCVAYDTAIITSLALYDSAAAAARQAAIGSGLK